MDLQSPSTTDETPPPPPEPAPPKPRPRLTLPARPREWFHLALAALAIFYVSYHAIVVLRVATRLDRSKFYVIKRPYDFNTLALPPMLLAVGAAGLWLARRRALGRWERAVSIGSLAGAALLIGVRLYATHWEPHQLKVKHVKIDAPGLGRTIRLLHISDLQVGRFGPYERRAFAAMRALKPDLVINTGDLLQPLPSTTYAAEYARLTAEMRALPAPLGKFNAIGNCEDASLAAPLERDTGFVTLLDRPSVIEVPGGGRLRLMGLAFTTAAGGPYTRLLVESWMLGAGPGDFSILFGHYPDYILTVENEPIGLCLAGHTHGGQIRIPFFGPILTFSKVPRAWARGFREVGRTRLNVSAGVGCEHAVGIPNLRLNCPPEMTLIELKGRSGLPAPT